VVTGAAPDTATLRALTPALIADLGTPYGWNDVTSLAAYAQGTFEFDDAWSLTAGLRFARDKIEQEKYFDNRVDLNGNVLFSPEAFAATGADPALAQAYSATARQLFANPAAGNVGMPGEPGFYETHKDRALLPAGKLEYRPDPDSLYYLSIQSGYKNGGYSTDGLKYPSEFDKEKSLAYELGGKWTLADGRGQATAAVFHTDFKNFQVATIDSTSGGVLFKNAAEAYTEGLELETRWKLTEEIAVSLQYAYLESRYRSFPGAPGSISQLIADPKATQDLGGKRLPNAPRNSASASVDYVQPLAGSLEFIAGVQVSYAGENYTDLADSEQLMAEAATLVNGRLAVTDTEAKWTVALIGTNLTNDRGQVYGTPSSIVGKGTYFGSIRPPATYWLQLEKRF
jgi:outer membrane receptor protein involved in Fe transport